MGDKINLARLIDHTLLTPSATEKDIKKLCNEAKKYGFFSVCVHPFFIRSAAKMLSGTDVKVGTVIGFPLGMTLSEVKIYEAMEAVSSGADELDMVINLGQAKGGRWEYVTGEISDLITATPGITHKIIIETCYLTEDEKIEACRAVMRSGAEFIKTSTGLGPAGATIEDVTLIKKTIEGTNLPACRQVEIKAAGGIKTMKQVMTFVKAGATRIGTSSGVGIMSEQLSNP